ncbi:LysR family transcriptional regulator [Nocardia tengchongensis]|uniref:LysR family transcriptional regulator n=1 Tax=Nocardia tengchongensis TaxID=2055889 RepID=UPI0036B30A86
MGGPVIERYEVETLLTLAEELHFGRTAERLRVSTARVSQTVSKLERRVGVPLFRRTSRRVELTSAGRQFTAAPRSSQAGRSSGANPAAATPGPRADLTLVGAGRGILPVGAHSQRYHARPDIAYVPLRGAPVVKCGLMWPADRNTARVRAFTAATEHATTGPE